MSSAALISMNVGVSIRAASSRQSRRGATSFRPDKSNPVERVSAGSVKELRNAANGATTLTFNAQKPPVLLTLLILPDNLANSHISGRISALSTRADNKPALLLSEKLRVYISGFRARFAKLSSPSALLIPKLGLTQIAIICCDSAGERGAMRITRKAKAQKSALVF